MLPLIRKTLIRIQRRARDKSLLAAIHKAYDINQETNKKVLVYLIKGQFECLTKQQVKALWKQGEFHPYSLREVEDMAYLDVTTKNILKMAQDKKLTAADIKALQEETKKKKGQTIKK